MSEYDGEVQLSVSLKPDDVKTSAKRLSDTISSIFKANAGKELDSSLKRVQASMDKTNNKAVELDNTLTKMTLEKTTYFRNLVQESTSLSKSIEDTQSRLSTATLEKGKGSQEVATLQTQLTNLESRYANVTEEMSRLTDAEGNIKFATEAQETAFNKVMTTLNELNNAQAVNIARWNELARKQGDVVTSTDAIAQAEKQSGQNMAESGNYAERTAQQWKNAFDLIKYSILDIPERLKSIPDAIKSGFTKASNTLKDTANSTEEVSSKLSKVAPKAVAASKGIKKFSTSLKSASKTSAGFNINIGKLFKKILMYGFGIRSVYLLVRKIRQAIAEGLNEMAKMNGGANDTNRALSALTSSFDAFKNSIAAAVAPLVNALAPALAKIIDLCTAAANKVAMLIAALTGHSTFMSAVKVQKNYAAGLDKTAKSAKKAKDALKGYLSPLDEINKYQSKQDDDAGAGGGAEAPAFKEMPVDNKMLDTIKKLKQMLEPIINRLKELKDKFIEGFKYGLGDVTDRVNRLKQGLQQIKDAIIDIWTDPQVLASANAYLDSLAFMLGTWAGSQASIGLTLATNIIAGLGQYLSENTDRIKEYLIDMFNIQTEVNYMLADLFADIADIFSVFAKDNGITITANLIGIFADAFMGILRIAARFERDLLQLVVKPIHDNKEAIKKALDDLLGSIADFTGIVKEEIDYIVDTAISTYDQHFKPLFDELAQDFSELTGKFLEAWTQYIQPAIDDIVAMARDSWNNYIKPVVDEIFGVLGDLADLILVIWQKKLKPSYDWIVANIMPVLGPIITGLGSIFKAFGDGVFTVIEYVLKNLRAFLQFLKEGFTQGWGQAWNNMSNKFIQNWENMWNKMKGVINKMLAGVEKMVNGIGRALNKLSLDDAPDWITDKLGGFRGFNIPNISLPRLAQGAVIPPNKEFMAVLGDQRQGTNIETPLETMKQAFRDALAEGGGGVKSIQFILPNRQVIAEYVIEGGRILQSARGENPFELA